MRHLLTNTIIVKIYKTRGGMRKAIRKVGYECKFTEAMVIPCTIYDCQEPHRKCKKVPISGELYIHEKATLPVLVHEALHAATTALRFKKESVDLTRKIGLREEQLAYTQTSVLQDVLKVFFPKKNSSYDFSDINHMAKGSLKASKRK